MKILKRTATAAAVGVLALGAVAAPSFASTATTVPLYGGVTKATANPGVAGYLVANGIIPSPAGSASASTVTRNGQQTVQFAFPISGGSSVTLTDGQLSGADIGHWGGVTFTNTANGKKITVGQFDISLADGLLYATKVNGSAVAGKGVPVFRLVPTTATPVITDGGVAIVKNVKLFLTAEAGSALNGALGTSAFPTDGSLKFGSARVAADITP